MVRSLTPWLVAALAVAAVASSADAQTIRRVPRHHGHVHYAVRPGDIVVHARPSYLTAGTSASPGEWGTGGRYVSDTTPYSFVQMGPPNAFGAQDFQVLPRMFDPPGQPVPIVEVW